MSEKFPYGYDLNAYIDKAFELLKADFPWGYEGYDSRAYLFKYRESWRRLSVCHLSESW